MKNKVMLFDTEFAKLNGLAHGANTTTKYLIDNRRIVLNENERQALYDTKGLASTPANAIVNSIIADKLTDLFVLVDSNISAQSLPELLAITDFTLDTKQLPSANVFNSIKEYKDKIVLNVAPIIKRSKEGYIRLNNLNDFHLMLVRGALVNSYYTCNQSYWLNPNLIKFITRTYSSCLAMPITRYFRLSIPEQLMVETILSYFILSRMADNASELLISCDFLGNKVTIRNSIDRIEEYLGSDELTLTRMCELMVACGPDHMSKFNSDIFKRMAGNVGSSSISSMMALEYPPYWVYQIIYTLSDNKTYLGILLQQTKLLKPTEQFLQQLISSRQFIPAMKVVSATASLDTVKAASLFDNYDNKYNFSVSTEGIGLLLLAGLAAALGISVWRSNTKLEQLSKELAKAITIVEGKINKSYQLYKTAYKNIKTVADKIANIDKKFVTVEIDDTDGILSIEEFTKKVTQQLASIIHNKRKINYKNGCIYQFVNSPLRIYIDDSIVYGSDEDDSDNQNKQLYLYLNAIKAVANSYSTKDIIYDVSDIGENNWTMIEINTFLTRLDIDTIISEIHNKPKSGTEGLFDLEGSDCVNTIENINTLKNLPVIKDISFPKNEITSLKDKSTIYTTRILDEINTFNLNDLVRAPWGAIYKVVAKDEYSDIDKHPFFKDLTDSQKSEIGKNPYVVLKLYKQSTESLSLNDNNNDYPELECFKMYTEIQEFELCQPDIYITQPVVNSFSTFELFNPVISLEDSNDKKNIITRIIEGIKKFINWIREAIGGFAKKVINFLKKLLGMKTDKVTNIREKLNYLRKDINIENKNDINEIVTKLNEFLKTKKTSVVPISIMQELEPLYNKFTGTLLEYMSDDNVTDEDLENLSDSLIPDTNKYNEELTAIFKGYRSGSAISSKQYTVEQTVFEYFKARTGKELIVSFDNIDNVYEDIYSQLSTAIDNINNIDVKIIDSIGIKCNEVLRKYQLELHHGKENATHQTIAVMVQGISQLISNIVYQSMNTEVIMYNNVLKIFESSLNQLVMIKSKTLVQNQTESISNMLKDLQVYATIEGHEVYSMKEFGDACEEHFPIIYQIFSQRNDSLIDGMTVRLPNASKMSIMLSTAALNDKTYHDVIIAHEYGHIKNNHTVVDMAKCMEYAVASQEGNNKVNNKIMQSIIIGCYRSVKNEVQADVEAVDRCGLENTLKLLHKLKNDHNIPGKVFGEPSNDINARIKFLETKMK